MTVYTSAAIHKEISQLDLRRIVVQTGGAVEDIRRTGEYRIKYESMGKPSPPANSRIKGVNKRIVNYVRHALRKMQPEEPVKPTTDTNVSEDTFASTLKRLREERGWSQADLCDRITALPTVGLNVEASLKEVSDWESGKSLPNNDQLARLFVILPRLREFEHLCGHSEDPADGKNPPDATESLAVKPLHQAIREARESERISVADAARLLGVSSNTLKSWENGRRFGKDSRPYRPSAASYNLLCELFPQLRSYPRPADLNTLKFTKKQGKKKRARRMGSSNADIGKKSDNAPVAAAASTASAVAVTAAPEAPAQASVVTMEALSLAYGKALSAVVEAEKLVAVKKAEAEAAHDALWRAASGASETAGASE